MTTWRSAAVLEITVAAVIMIAVLVFSSCGTSRPPAGSLVCGEDGASYEPGWDQCRTLVELACSRARTACQDNPSHDGCSETGFARIATPDELVAACPWIEKSSVQRGAR